MLVPAPALASALAPSLAPSLDDIAVLAHAAWAELPAGVRAMAGEVVFRIEDLASDEVLADMEIDDPFELSGLYQGVDLTRRSVSDPAPGQPMVFLYRRALLDEWIDRGDVTLGELVFHVLVHEIGHHFGLGDDAMDALLEEAD